MTAITKKNDGNIQPADVRLQEAAIAVLIERIQSLDNETKDDLMEVLMDLRTCTTPEEVREVEQTIQEMLCPQLVGELVPGRSVDGQNGQLASWAKKIGETIKNMREKKQLTQHDLAKAAGLRQSHISRLENGQHSPSHKTLLALANALGVTVSDIDPAADQRD